MKRASVIRGPMLHDATGQKEKKKGKGAPNLPSLRLQGLTGETTEDHFSFLIYYPSFGRVVSGLHLRFEGNEHQA